MRDDRTGSRGLGEVAGPLGTAEAIGLCVPEIQGNEWKYIKQCLDDNWVSSVGPFVDRFERELSTAIGARHAVATVSGTAALHVALLVAGVRPEDEVLVSALSFIAPANAIRYAGAWPVFMDAEPEYGQMDPQRVADFVERDCRWGKGGLRNAKTGRRIRAIVPVHILGHPVDMDPIVELARKYDLTVIEDAGESLGARYKDQPVGRLGDIACFSFNGNKIVTAGGGGMIVTDNEAWAERARYLTTQAKDEPVESVHAEIGYNYRLTNIQAAMGCAQMEKLDEYIAAKRRIGGVYGAALRDVRGIKPLGEASWALSTCWLYTVLVDDEEYGMDSRALLAHLGKEGIQTRPLWQPLHRSPAHTGSAKAECPVAERLNRDGLSLPCSVGLTEAQQERVLDTIVSYASERNVARGR